MKVYFKYCLPLLLFMRFLLSVPAAFGQLMKSYTFGSAYNVLNSSTSTATSSPVTYVGNVTSNVSSAATTVTQLYQMDKKWNISLGIPTQVALDYAYLKWRMVSAYEENPDLYWNGSQEFKEAVDILGWGDFVTISSWAPVRCTVTFRFIPPVLGDNYDLKYDYRINPSAAPEKGKSTFWIR
jgi:hypothetical protein